MSKKLLIALCLSVILTGCTPRAIEDNNLTPKINLVLEEVYPEPLEINTTQFSKESERLYRDVPLSYKLQDDINDACNEFNVDPDIIYAVMKVESNYQVDAENGDCIGLMQISAINVPYLLEKIGVMNLHNPTDNIRAGTYILSEALSKYSLIESLMVYNNGETGAQKLWKQGIYETDYTRKVIDAIKGDKKCQE